MNERFEQLDPAKRERILTACLAEFSEKGYEQASTNKMIKRAGISKGLLFHYFGSKKGLYLYLVDYALHTVIEHYERYPMEYSGDIFARLLEIGMIKLKLSLAHPEMSRIIIEAFLTPPQEISREIQAKYEQFYAQWVPAIFQRIDLAKFRSGVNPAKAIEILSLFLEALEQKYRKMFKGREQDLLKEVEPLLEEYREYFEILKYGMYVRGNE